MRVHVCIVRTNRKVAQQIAQEVRAKDPEIMARKDPIFHSGMPTNRIFIQHNRI